MTSAADPMPCESAVVSAAMHRAISPAIAPSCAWTESSAPAVSDRPAGLGIGRGGYVGSTWLHIGRGLPPTLLRVLIVIAGVTASVLLLVRG